MFISQPGPLPWTPGSHKSERLLPQRSLPISSPQTLFLIPQQLQPLSAQARNYDDIPDSSISLTACIQASANPTFSFAHLSVFMRPGEVSPVAWRAGGALKGPPFHSSCHEPAVRDVSPGRTTPPTAQAETLRSSPTACWGRQLAALFSQPHSEGQAQAWLGGAPEAS